MNSAKGQSQVEEHQDKILNNPFCCPTNVGLATGLFAMGQVGSCDNGSEEPANHAVPYGLWLYNRHNFLKERRPWAAYA